jgi:hypothetical protein
MVLVEMEKGNKNIDQKLVKLKELLQYGALPDIKVCLDLIRMFYCDNTIFLLLYIQKCN